MKKIYITGIAGLLGFNLAYLLIGKYQISGCDLEAVHQDGIRSERLNLLEQNALRKSILLDMPDIIVHTAAAVNVEDCEAHPEMTYCLNVRATEFITDLCEELGIKLVFISSDAVFQGDKLGLYQEEDEPLPRNIYGKSKLEAEKYVLKYRRNLVLRTNIYGYNFQQKNSFGEWILDSLLKNQTLHMFTDITFSPILVNDFAVILDQILSCNLTGLYHICATGSITKYEFGVAIKKIFGIETGIIIRAHSSEADFKADRALNMGMSNQKLSSELTIKMKSPLEGIRYFKELYVQGYPEVLKNMGK